jgi:hypothetical protein
MFVRRVSKDPLVLEQEFPPVREKVYKDFADRLRPLKRWLLSHDGRTWEEVFAKIKILFDDRTTAGRHILEHLFQEISKREPDGSLRYRSIVTVDRHGIVRTRPDYNDTPAMDAFEEATTCAPMWDLKRGSDGPKRYDGKHGKRSKHSQRLARIAARKKAQLNK